MKKTLCICLLLVITFFVTAQTDTTTAKLTRFVKNINAFNKQYPQEKVYLHFDNTGYYLGETIWFKAYVVTAEEHLPTTLSRVLYVELLNPEGDVVITKKLKVENGQCHGDFQLKDSLYAGYYEVRAYTRYMLNFGKTEYTQTPRTSMKPKTYESTSSENIAEYTFYPWAEDTDLSFRLQKIKQRYQSNPWFEHTIIDIFKKKCVENGTLFCRVFPVYNKPEILGNYNEKTMRERQRRNNQNFSKQEMSRVMSIAFFPEGGSLIAGLTSNIAFKAQSEKGEDINIRGEIKNADGKTVAQLQTKHQGMGSFQLTPDDRLYTAEVYYRDSVCKFSLPAVQSVGFTLHVNATSDDSIQLLIQKSNTLTTHSLGFTVSCRAKVLLFDTIEFDSNAQVLMTIPKNKLKTGVNQLTLFDSSGKILAERLLFVNHQEYNQYAFKVLNQQQLYSPYAPIKLDVLFSNSTTANLEQTFSLSVRDAETEDITYHTDNVMTNLLLSSDLKGYIANPAYYFESNDSVHSQALDLLMLTQGWRRYSWTQMSKKDAFVLTQPIEKGLQIDGTVNKEFHDRIYKNTEEFTNSLTQRTLPFTEVQLYLSASDSVMKFGKCITDSEGYFKFLVGDFKGSADVKLVTFEKRWGKTVLQEHLFAINRRFSPEPTPSFSYYQTTIPSTANGSVIGFQRRDSLLKTLSLKGVTVKAKRVNRNKFDYSNPNYRMSAKEELDKIQDITLVRDPDFSTLVRFACIRRGFSGVTVRVVNDFFRGSIRAEKQSIADLDSIYIYTDLANRKRYSTPEELASQYIPDVVVKLKSYKRDVTSAKDKGYRETKLQGYSYVSEFYSPNYKNNALPEKKDFRRTLYWNPDVKTDSNGKAQVSFYNNSTCKHINISAETVTKEGVPVVGK